MARTAVLGFPRVGPNRELKFALESYWSGKTSWDELLEMSRGLQAANWKRLQAAGIDVIPSSDFSFYDHILDATWGFGAIPKRFGKLDPNKIDDYFALARGTETEKPLDMTKWFDTNYHYLVPELASGQTFQLNADHWIYPLKQAQELGITTRPVIVGPLTYLLLSKGLDNPLDALDALIPVYEELLQKLAENGAQEVQIDEPILVQDRTPAELKAFTKTWKTLVAAAPQLKICLTTYFDGLTLDGVLNAVAQVPVAELHIDLVRAPEQLEPVLEAFRDSQTRLSLGLVDGRNVWATDLDRAAQQLDAAVAAVGTDRITIAPSCSLLHVPFTSATETNIDPEVHSWLAFAVEKLTELHVLHEAVDAKSDKRDGLFATGRKVINSRRTSARTNNPAVRSRVNALKEEHYNRKSAAPARQRAQRERMPLPDLPTTTIGSYPQTSEIRTARKDLREGRMSQGDYEKFLESQISHVVDVQQELGLDVLVHGEPERNDMVEYFGQQLDGFTFSKNGWVQSYGSRCVKPPILFGDVSRPAPMTVRWWEYAQSLTNRPMKGMLTGPVTILQWSFVRDDQPRRDTCTQIAFAIQDEVMDLEAAGAKVIQVDEAALREGLPLQRHEQDDYVRWAVDCFRLTVAPTRDETQIHTHMCYSEFNDMMEHIVRLDADVLLIEASRSNMEVLDTFTGSITYPNDIGPGVYDIHSPRIPSVEEMERLLELAEKRIGRDHLWVNPDCGLKTRKWEEVLPSLANMMQAARRRRESLG